MLQHPNRPSSAIPGINERPIEEDEGCVEVIFEVKITGYAMDVTEVEMG